MEIQKVVNSRVRIVSAPLFLCCLLTVVWCTLYFGGVRFIHVEGDSMLPTYKSGDTLLGVPATEENIKKQNYPCVVVSVGGNVMIKRLVGYPGDTVELIEGVTYVNNQRVLNRLTDCWDNERYILGADEYLVLGDNRANSNDGRYWPGHFVHMDNIKLVAVHTGI